MKRSIFITPELLVRIEQNQRHSIGNEKVGIESANKKNFLGINMVLDPLSLLVAIPDLTVLNFSGPRPDLSMPHDCTK